MKILFDQGTPVPLRSSLVDHNVATTYECGWSTKNNGDLLHAAESAGFECLVTTDANLKYQQNLADRKIAIVVLKTTSWPKIQRSVSLVVAAIARAGANTYEEIEFL